MVQTESLHSLSDQIRARGGFVDKSGLEGCIGPNVFASENTNYIEQWRPCGIWAEDDTARPSG